MQLTEQFTSHIVPGEFHCTQVVSSDGTEAAWPGAQNEAGQVVGLSEKSILVLRCLPAMGEPDQGLRAKESEVCTSKHSLC